MKIIFMGTPDFAAKALDALCEAGHEVVLVVTQPDKPKGRSGKLAPSPVKEIALERQLPLFQPVKIREEDSIKRIEDVQADIAVVAAFGQLLPERLLGIPTYGCVNIHASLLPKYRGASPIQQAIADGEKVTGITLMQMDVGMDTGDILMQEQVEIAPEDTAGTLFDKLADRGAALIVKALPLIEQGALTPVKQDPALATKCGKISKEAGRIDWTKNVADIVNHIRAYTPWPAAYCLHEGRMMKILQAEALIQGTENVTVDYLPGTVLRADKKGIEIGCKDGSVRILKLQPEGKKPMDAAGFLNGHKLTAGTLFSD